MYRTKLTYDGKATLEKELSVNCPEVGKQISCPQDVDNLARKFLKMHEETEEYCYLVCVNNKNMLTSIFEISHGNINTSIVGVREVYQKALLANAVSILVMHNHPSGDPTPSQQDIDITKRLQEAGKIIGINILDHLIIGRPGFCSLKEKGIL